MTILNKNSNIYLIYRERYFQRKNEYYESIRQKKANGKGNDVDVVKTKGAILKISGIDKDTKFTDIKEELSKHSKVAFVSNVNEQSEVNC